MKLRGTTKIFILKIVMFFPVNFSAIFLFDLEFFLMTSKLIVKAFLFLMNFSRSLSVVPVGKSPGTDGIPYSILKRSLE